MTTIAGGIILTFVALYVIAYVIALVQESCALSSQTTRHSPQWHRWFNWLLLAACLAVILRGTAKTLMS
jgi:hypothetical protein